MSDRQKEQKDTCKMSDKFVTPDKDAIIVKRKKKPSVKKGEKESE